MLTLNFIPKKRCTMCEETKPAALFNKKARYGRIFLRNTLRITTLESYCQICGLKKRNDRLRVAHGLEPLCLPRMKPRHTHRVCKTCNILKPAADFYPRFMSRCKPCHSQYRKDYLARVPDLNKRHAVRRMYKISLEQKEALLASQGGLCAICKTSKPGGKGWAIDHDHACCSIKNTCGNCIRGILCSNCNNGLGCARDNIDVLTSMIAYLMKNPRPLQQSSGA